MVCLTGLIVYLKEVPTDITSIIGQTIQISRILLLIAGLMNLYFACVSVMPSSDLENKT